MFSSAANEGERLDGDDAISLTSFDPAASALLGYAQEEQEMSRAKKLRLSPLNTPALRMMSCWRLWNAPRRGFTCRGSGPRWRRGVKKKKKFLKPVFLSHP